MNRRDFLRKLIAVPLAAKLVPDNPLNLYFDPVKLQGAPVIKSVMWDKNAIYFIAQYNLWVNNPRSCAIITDIANGE